MPQVDKPIITSKQLQKSIEDLSNYNNKHLHDDTNRPISNLLKAKQDVTRRDMNELQEKLAKEERTDLAARRQHVMAQKARMQVESQNAIKEKEESKRGPYKEYNPPDP